MSKKVAIVTDSNSNISQEFGKSMGVFVVPMPFYINDELYFEEVSITNEKFYELQSSGAHITTSQPSPGEIMDLWDSILQEYDEILHIPMSSGLSGSCESAMSLVHDYEGKVVVVDNGRISLPLKQAVLDALHLAKEGKSAKEIQEVLEAHKEEFEIFISVETLEYLKKGGRITPAAAAIGTVLSVKPVLQIGTKKIDSFAKARGMKKAQKVMFEAMEIVLNERFKGEKMDLGIAYTCSSEKLEVYLEDVKAYFPDYDIEVAPLSLSIAAHIGPGAIAITCNKSVVNKESF